MSEQVHEESERGKVVDCSADHSSLRRRDSVPHGTSVTASPGGGTMAEPTEPLTPEEEAALRELAARHRRRHRWLALFWSVTVSAHTTIILHTIWHD
jgi:hypothetical protein